MIMIREVLIAPRSPQNSFRLFLMFINNVGFELDAIKEQAAMRLNFFSRQSPLFSSA